MLELRLIYTQWLKFRKNILCVILGVFPLCYTGFMLFYNANAQSAFACYSTFFNVMGIFMPIGIGMITAILGECEYDAGHFKALLGLQISRNRIYSSQVIFILLVISAEVIGSTCLMLIGMKYFLHLEHIEMSPFIQGALFGLLGAVNLCLSHFILGYIGNIGVSIGCGSIGFLVAALIGGTNLGDQIWWLIPWTYTVRFAEIPYLQFEEIANNSLMNHLIQYKKSMALGLGMNVVYCFLFLIIGMIWFNRWEGRRKIE